MEENKDLSNWTSIEKENFKGVFSNVKNWHIHITDGLDEIEFLSCILKIMKYAVNSSMKVTWSGLMRALLNKLLEDELISIEVKDGKININDINREV